MVCGAVNTTAHITSNSPDISQVDYALWHVYQSCVFKMAVTQADICKTLSTHGTEGVRTEHPPVMAHESRRLFAVKGSNSEQPL